MAIFGHGFESSPETRTHNPSNHWLQRKCMADIKKPFSRRDEGNMDVYRCICNIFVVTMAQRKWRSLSGKGYPDKQQ